MPRGIINLRRFRDLIRPAEWAHPVTETPDPSRDEKPAKPAARPVTETPDPSRDGDQAKSQNSKPVIQLVKPAGTTPKPAAKPGPKPARKRVEKAAKKAIRKPPKTELEKVKALLPETAGRWTVEHEGYAYKIRRVIDIPGSTKTTRFFRIRWATWEFMRKNYNDNQIRSILTDKVKRKEAELETLGRQAGGNRHIG